MHGSHHESAIVQPLTKCSTTFFPGVISKVNDKSKTREMVEGSVVAMDLVGGRRGRTGGT